MDLSTLTESQQQQLQQLHQQFQQHQLQQHQEHQQQQDQHYIQQEIASQSYDPSQAQSYDQATQAYYAYHQSQPQPHQQNYPYYHPDYANSYQQQPSQTESTPVQPPGISIPPEASQSSAAPNQQNAYYPQGVVGEQQNSSGLNPAAAAAVAALSQLTQFAGTMDAAERAMAGLHEREWQANNGGYGPMPNPGPGPGPGPGPMMYHGPDSMHPPHVSQSDCAYCSMNQMCRWKK